MADCAEKQREGYVARKFLDAEHFAKLKHNLEKELDAARKGAARRSSRMPCPPSSSGRTT